MINPIKDNLILGMKNPLIGAKFLFIIIVSARYISIQI
jgi:hypothetical protein